MLRVLFGRSLKHVCRTCLMSFVCASPFVSSHLFAQQPPFGGTADTVLELETNDPNWTIALDVTTRASSPRHPKRLRQSNCPSQKFQAKSLR